MFCNKYFNINFNLYYRPKKPKNNNINNGQNSLHITQFKVILRKIQHSPKSARIKVVWYVLFSDKSFLALNEKILTKMFYEK